MSSSDTVQVRRGWHLSVCEAAGEAGGSYRSGRESDRVPTAPPPPDPERSAREAARRARRQVRRYCAANRLNRLGTLTYRGEGCHDPLLLRRHVGVFFRELRARTGGKPFAYVWVPEWHKTDHGLHVHFAVGQYINRRMIEAAWGHGFVHIKLIGNLPVGSGPLQEARVAAGYLSKYATKAFDDDRQPGLHRYEVAEGFQPNVVRVYGRTLADATRDACKVMGGQRPDRAWSSDEVADWKAPPAVWFSWR